MTPVSAVKPNPAHLPQQTALPTKWSLVKEVANATFKELAISMAFVSVAGFFVATSVGLTTLLITAITVVAINTLIRSTGAFLTYKLSRHPNPHSASYRYFNHARTVCNYLAPISFSVLDGATRDALMNEGGRAAAAALLYKNAHPQIEIVPLQGGVTRYTVEGLTKMGNFFGPEKAARIVAGAATATSLFVSSIQFIVAHKIRNSHPTISRYLQVTAIVSLANQALYVLTKGSIVGTISIVALPILVKLGLYYLDHGAPRKFWPLRN